MAGSADTADVERGPRPFAARVIDWHWKWPVLISSICFLVLLGAVLSAHSASGAGLVPDGEPGLLGLGNRVRMDIVVSFVAAYTLGAGLIGLGMATRAFDRLRPLLNLGDPERQAFRDRLTPDAQALLIVALIGGAVGVALDLLPYVFDLGSRTQVSVLGVPFMFLLFALLGMMTLITTRQSQVFHEVGRLHIEADLLDLGSLSPFSSLGLTNAGFWFTGSALASFLVTSDAVGWLVALVIVATLGLGVAALILPSRGLHGRLQDRKREELARIRDAIASERAGLFSATDGSSPASRMPALLAYEARIEGVREWPFDTTTLSRFGLFLLIPLVSWIGGALVERAVDAALA